MKQVLFSAVLLAVVAVCTAPADASIVTISSNYVVAEANDGFASNYDIFSGTSIPTSTPLSAVAGAASSDVDIHYYTLGGQTILNNQFDFVRTGDYASYSYIYNGSTHFSVDADTTYDLSGFIDVTDVGDAGRVYMFGFLFDVTTHSYAAYSEQESLNTQNESFTLGGAGGDNAHTFSGSLTGTLIAGHSYEWYYNTLIQADPDGDSGGFRHGSDEAHHRRNGARRVRSRTVFLPHARRPACLLRRHRLAPETAKKIGLRFHAKIVTSPAKFCGAFFLVRQACLPN